jgi:hypothetical protein
MNKFNPLNIYTNPQPIPSVFNEGFSQYETIKYLIGLINQLIENENLSVDEIDELNNKKVSMEYYITDLKNTRKLDENGNFTGLLNGMPIVQDQTGLSSTVAFHTSQLQQINDVMQLDIFKKYGYNIKRHSIYNSDGQSYSGRDLVILGDSHFWGEGSPNYEGASDGYSIHAPWIHNSGMGDRLRKYLLQKFDTKPWRVTFDSSILGIENTVANWINDYTPLGINQDLFTISPKIKGKFYISSDTTGGHILCSAPAKNDITGGQLYQYNSEIGLFGKYVMVMGKNDNGVGEIIVDIPKPTRYIYLHAGRVPQGTDIKLELMDNSSGQNKTSGSFLPSG